MDWYFTVTTLVRGTRQAIRDAIQAHTGKTPIPAPPPPKVVAYGSVPLSQSAVLTQQLGALASHAGISARVPLHMEEYGQQYALVLHLPVWACLEPLCTGQGACLHFSDPCACPSVCMTMFAGSFGEASPTLCDSTTAIASVAFLGNQR